MGSNKSEIFLKSILGATEAPAVQLLTLYIPNKNKNGNIITDINKWIDEAQNVLTQIGGGATTMPPADGTWLNPNNKEIIREKTVLIYTYIDPDGFEEHYEALTEFLHRFGRETNQGEVVCEFHRKFYKINKFRKG